MNNNLNEIDNYYKLRDEIQFCVNCIIYIKEKIKNVNELNNQKDKLNDVFNNLEQLCQKEIDLINEGIVCYINNNENNDDNLKNFIINNYKKIIDTFNKIMSINIIKDLYSNYINNNNNSNENNESFNVNNNNNNFEDEKKNEKENLNNIINKFKENLIKCNYVPKKENKNDFNLFIKKKFNNNNNNFNYENNLKFIKEIESKIDNIKMLKENLQNKINNNCILNNEKKNYEKLKNENLILINDINFIKENLISLENVYKNLVQKLTILEEEQIELLNHNKELISYVKNKYIQNNNNIFTNQSNNDNLNNIKLNNNNYNNKIINSNNNLEISHLTSNPSSIEMMNKINKNIN